MRKPLYIALTLVVVFAIASMSSFPQYLYAAESLIDATVTTTAVSGVAAAPGVVCISDQQCFALYRDSTGNMDIASSSDGGTTWTSRDADPQTDAIHGAMWWDGWTPPGTSTQYIHIVTTDTTADDAFYTRYDTTTGATTTTIAAPTVPVAAPNETCTEGTDCYPSITHLSNGRLVIAWNETNRGHMSFCDTTCTTGSNWTIASTTGPTRAGYYASGDDPSFIVPMPEHPNNIMLVYFDTNQTDMLYNVWSATTSDWVYAKTATQTIDSTVDFEATYETQRMGISMSSTTNEIGLVYAEDVNDYTTQDHDIAFWKYTDATGWVRGTDVVTNASGGITATKLTYDNSNNVWYAIYGRRSTISVATTTSIYYRTSSDGGTTWSAESAAINDSTGMEIVALTADISSFERIAATWRYRTINDQYFDTVADISPPAPPTVILSDPEIYYFN